MTTEPGQRSTLEKAELRWAPPPLKPLEIAAVASIFVLFGAIVFAREFDPAPREASRNVHTSLLILAGAVPTIALGGRKLLADLPRAAPLGFIVFYLLFSVWLGDVEPHRMIPWYLNPLTVLMATCIGTLIGGLVRARHGLSART